MKNKKLLFMCFTIATLLVVLVFVRILFKSEKNTENEAVVEISPSPLPLEETKVPATTLTPTDSPVPVETKTPVKEEVVLSFVGDVFLSDGVLRNYDKKGIDGIVSKSISKSLIESDFTMVNQEFPFSTRGTKMQNKQYTFRIPPERINILEEMGVDMVTLANNHALDFGIDALMDTFSTLDGRGMEYVGAGKDLDRAKQIIYKTIEGRKIAFVAASRVIPDTNWNATTTRPGMLTTYDPALLIEQIRIAEEEADFTIVYVHWGLERHERPEEYQRIMGKQYVDAGADLVLGSHPHCLQGIEYYQGKPIIYSLGNFVFGSAIERTLILQTFIDKDLQLRMKIIPCFGKNFYTEEVKKEQLDTFYQYLTDISFQITIDEDGEIYPK